MGFLLTLCLTLRQFLTERKKSTELKSGMSDISMQSGSANTLVNQSIQNQIIHWIYSMLIKYWIFLSSATLLLMSCQNQVVAYRIGYMILFLYFITTFQVN